jgi:ABC-type uncharacterized transport system substrate-binding protein
MMRRRDFIALATAWPLAARGQQKAMPVIGFLHTLSPDWSAPFVTAFLSGLAESGYIADQNVAIEYRWAEGNYDRLPALADELIGRNVDVIATGGGSPAALAAKQATTTTPVVFANVGEPVGSGLVASLARPGGNVTGISIIPFALVPKRLELLSELVPDADVLALLVNPDHPLTERAIEDAQKAADKKRLRLHVLKARSKGEIDAAYRSLGALHAKALVVGPDVLFARYRERLVELASTYAIPAIYDGRNAVLSGGLISYGSDRPSVYRQAGAYVGRILSGAKPADLPVQQPTTFELIINLKAAKALGLTVPQSILARADEVIE